MTIIPPHNRLTKEQYIKLFSNPVSGIACGIEEEGTNYTYVHGARYYLADIRYSKSMLIKAVEFWIKQFVNQYFRIKSINNYNPIFHDKEMIKKWEDDIVRAKNTVLQLKQFPNSFLFSHRWIECNNNVNRGMTRQLKAITDKYPFLNTIVEKKLIAFQERTMDPCFYITLFSGKLCFSVFPNIHPYISRDKIKALGVTAKENVFVIFDRKDNKKK